MKKHLLLNLLGLALILYALVSVQIQGDHLNAQQRVITRDRRSLVATQNLLLTSVKASAETRVTTVTQRCKFTSLVLDVLVKQDPAVSAPFSKSLHGCLVQLAVVKKIAANAPTIPSIP